MAKSDIMKGLYGYCPHLMSFGNDYRNPVITGILRDVIPEAPEIFIDLGMKAW